MFLVMDSAGIISFWKQLIIPSILIQEISYNQPNQVHLDTSTEILDIDFPCCEMAQVQTRSRHDKARIWKKMSWEDHRDETGTCQTVLHSILPWG